MESLIKVWAKLVWYATGFLPWEREPCPQLIRNLVDTTLRQKSKRCMFVCMSVWVCACVCVHRREGEEEWERKEKERERERVKGGGEGEGKCRRRGREGMGLYCKRWEGVYYYCCLLWGEFLPHNSCFQGGAKLLIGSWILWGGS